MIEISIAQKLFIDFAVFYSLILLQIFIIIFGKNVDKERKLRYNWFLIFVGILLLSLIQLASIALTIEIITENLFSVFKSIFSLSAGISITIGVVSVTIEKILEYSNLKRRYNELQEIILNLKEKFLKGRISRKEFEEIVKDLIKEESEIEVKIKKFEKKK